MDFSKSEKCSKEAAKIACKVSFPELAGGTYNVKSIEARMIANPAYESAKAVGDHREDANGNTVDEKLVYLELTVKGKDKPYRVTPWQLTRDSSADLGLDQSMNAIEIADHFEDGFTLNVSDRADFTIVTRKGPKMYRTWSLG